MPGCQSQGEFGVRLQPLPWPLLCRRMRWGGTTTGGNETGNKNEKDSLCASNWSPLIEKRGYLWTGRPTSTRKRTLDPDAEYVCPVCQVAFFQRHMPNTKSERSSQMTRSTRMGTSLLFHCTEGLRDGWAAQATVCQLRMSLMGIAGELLHNSGGEEKEEDACLQKPAI